MSQLKAIVPELYLKDLTVTTDMLLDFSDVLQVKHFWFLETCLLCRLVNIDVLTI